MSDELLDDEEDDTEGDDVEDDDDEEESSSEDELELRAPVSSGTAWATDTTIGATGIVGLATLSLVFFALGFAVPFALMGFAEGVAGFLEAAGVFAGNFVAADFDAAGLRETLADLLEPLVADARFLGAAGFFTAGAALVERLEEVVVLDEWEDAGWVPTVAGSAAGAFFLAGRDERSLDFVVLVLVAVIPTASFAGFAVVSWVFRTASDGLIFLNTGAGSSIAASLASWLFPARHLSAINSIMYESNGMA